MKAIILGDSHGNLGVLQRIIDREAPFDLLFHLGDGIEDGLRLKLIKDFNFDAVNGNNDPRDAFPLETVIKFGRYRCFFTHGHYYQVNDQLDQMVNAAKKERAAIVFYGHTHHYSDQQYKGVRLVNPGTVCRYLNKIPSYLSLEVKQGDLLIQKVDLPGK